MDTPALLGFSEEEGVGEEAEEPPVAEGEVALLLLLAEPPASFLEGSLLPQLSLMVEVQLSCPVLLPTLARLHSVKASSQVNYTR